MKALVFRPGLPASVEEVGGFKDIQRLCQGFVERVVLDWGAGPSKRYIQLWVNEDGIAQRCPLNLLAQGPAYPSGAPIFGTAVLLAARRTTDDEEDLGLTDEEIARWAGAFRRAPTGLTRGELPYVEEETDEDLRERAAEEKLAAKKNGDHLS